MRESPSTDARLSNFREIQTSGRKDAVHNNRPFSLSYSPIRIFHPVFARFRSRMGQPLETFHFTPEQRQIAMQLLEAANDVHESENSRRYRYTQVLRKALRKDVFPNEEYEDSTTLSYKTPASGGHRVITCPFLPDGSCAATCWTDFTAELGSLDSDPNTRSECNYALAVTSDKVA